ncbi:hypothetical protein evm_007206 [Chilo suppressalis]|nr:hypothetical protein evm_007206 [Chilo suppressalis]
MKYLLTILLTAIPAFGWQFYTSLNDYTLIGTAKTQLHVHSEYYFGHCKPGKGLMFYSHIHKTHMEILGKLIIRGWIEVLRIPTCIILRANSHEYDLMRSSAYNFQFCVPRITYSHSQKRYKYFYYEWYIPEDMVGGMDWDIYFYGPSNIDWQ